MKKNVSITAALVVALFAGLAPVRTAQAAPLGQVRALGNFSQRFNGVPVTAWNTQTRLGNLGGNLVTSQAIRSADAFQTLRQPVLDRITWSTPPVVTGDLTRQLHPTNGLIHLPIDISSPTFTLADAARLLADTSGGGIGGKDSDGNDGNNDNNNNGGGGQGGKGGSGGRGGGSGRPPVLLGGSPPTFYGSFVYYDDDDDEEEEEDDDDDDE